MRRRSSSPRSNYSLVSRPCYDAPSKFACKCRQPRGRSPLTDFWSRLSAYLVRPWFGPLCLAVLATLAVLCALDPAGDYPSRAAGPGLTVDEIFNVDLGARLADQLLTGDFAGAIRTGQMLPDHPPLGRLWLGMFHEMVLLFAPPSSEHSALVIAAARVGSAVAFGILVWLAGFTAARWYGNPAGWGAAAALVLMPRVFGHAHLAALETVLNLTYFAAVISVAQTWSGSAAPSVRAALLSGIWLGLALLTKIQAIFIPIPVAIWVLVNWRQRALWPLLVWGLTGLVVFVGGWPWLWLDPLGNVLRYLGHASERSVIQVWYCGQMFADRDVPWHYPWVLFATTVPLGLHLLGLLGVCVRRPAVAVMPAAAPPISVKWFLLASVLFPLCMFSLPGVAVYDGDRLFLIVFPLWALFIGRGVTAVWQWLVPRVRAFGAASLLGLFLTAQGVGLWQLAPCWLSYYNATVGGLAGANTLGFQVTYWGDSVTRELLWQSSERVPAGATVDVAPVLHPFQLAAWESQCPRLRARNLKLRPFDRTAPAEYLLVYYRRDYLPTDWKAGPAGYQPLFEIVRQETVLAGLYQRVKL